MSSGVEPVFQIRGQDRLASAAIEAYRDLCADAGLTEQAKQVDLALAEVRQWQEDYPDAVKDPDHTHVPASLQAPSRWRRLEPPREPAG